MKLYLDDERKPPFGWDLVKTANECIAVLGRGKVEELALDHDLAEEHYEPSSGLYREKTGYDVCLWMVENEVWPKHIILHSLNPVGRLNMKQLLTRYAPAGVVIEERPGWKRGS
jgi:hypothetical protein